MSDIKLCLVIPCYNEEVRLPVSDFSEFLTVNPNISCLFVNDGSTDQTSKVLSDLCLKHNNSSFLDLEKNGGKAEAVRRGFVHAHSLDKYSHIGFFDADLATPLSEVSSFTQSLERKSYSVVMGSRVLRVGRNIRRAYKRHLLGRLFSFVASVVLKLPVYDTQCGAKVFDSKVVGDLFLKPFISHWIFDVELLFRLKKLISNDSEFQDQIYELPLHEWRDVEGSKLSAFDFLKAPFELIKIYSDYKK